MGETIVTPVRLGLLGAGRIAQSAHLFDTRLALLELAKGKFTTAPEGH